MILLEGQLFRYLTYSYRIYIYLEILFVAGTEIVKAELFSINWSVCYVIQIFMQ